MSNDEATEKKIIMAKQAAIVMQSTLAGVPGEVQIEAALMLVKALFMTQVKPTHRLSLFSAVAAKMKAELKAGAKPTKESRT